MVLITCREQLVALHGSCGDGLVEFSFFCLILLMLLEAMK